MLTRSPDKMNLFIFLSYLFLLVTAHEQLVSDGSTSLAKRDWTCPQDYHYLTKAKGKYNYYCCCPNADDQMLIPEDYNKPPVCCKKGAKLCNGASVSIRDWCRPGQEVTQQGGIVGCRALSSDARTDMAVAERATPPQCPAMHIPVTSDDHDKAGYYYVFCCTQSPQKPYFPELEIPDDYQRRPRCCVNNNKDCTEIASSFIEGFLCDQPGQETTDWLGIKGCRSKNRGLRSVDSLEVRAPQDPVPNPAIWGGAKHCPDDFAFYEGGPVRGYEYSFCCPWISTKLKLPATSQETPRCCHGLNGACPDLARSMLVDGKCQHKGEEITEWNGVIGCRKEVKKRDTRSDQFESHHGILCDTRPCPDGWHELHIGTSCYCTPHPPAPSSTEPHFAPTHEPVTGFISNEARDAQYSPTCNPFAGYTHSHDYGVPPEVSAWFSHLSLPPCPTTMDTITGPGNAPWASATRPTISKSGTTTKTVTLPRSTSVAAVSTSAGLDAGEAPQATPCKPFHRDQIT
jgi:hypothetical protein